MIMLWYAQMKSTEQQMDHMYFCMNVDYLTKMNISYQHVSIFITFELIFLNLLLADENRNRNFFKSALTVVVSNK